MEEFYSFKAYRLGVAEVPWPSAALVTFQGASHPGWRPQKESF